MISLEINEINKKWVEHYVNKGRLKSFKNIFKNYPVIETTSEKKYEELEPWIQWPSFYSGLDYSHHKCFHIGDFYKNQTPNIFDDLQDLGLNVLSISPMNCYFKERGSSILVPDPWENFNTRHKGFLSNLYESIKAKVNTNAYENNNLKHNTIFLLGLLRYGRVKNYLKYAKYIFLSLRYKWSQAIVLDLLLFDIFIKYQKDGDYGYSSIFLNAGAHIQHHHLYDSDCYKGDNQNPKSYSLAANTHVDPIFEVLSVYDEMIEEVISGSSKFMITTGLQQIENKKPYYQYRFIDHEKTMTYLGFSFKTIIARMSRDFTIYFNDKNQMEQNMKLFGNIYIDNKPLFSVDEDPCNLSVFVKINWTGDISNFKNIQIENKKELNIKKQIALVSIENSIHTDKGWHLRNFENDNKNSSKSIWEIKNTILAYFKH